ncbi:MAG: family intrarane metalloprotease [Massilia sp.]|nr:family intrarane metalloprotease [Massilia sp.]
MTTVPDATQAAQGRGGRLLRFPLVKIVMATVLAVATAKLMLALARAVAGQEARIIWPQVLAAIAVLLTYGAYVRHVEKRAATELSPSRALPELGVGLAIGAAMVAAQVGILYALGYYQVSGMNAWTMQFVQPLAVMLLVGVLEEVIGRGIVFRITEESLGSWPAIAISALLFGLVHLPNEGAGILAIGITVAAGAFFAAAYMVTRRLWLCIGIHVAWNYTLGSIFSSAVSGHESKGLLVGNLTGPDWISGGSFGLEASILTLLSLVLVGGWFLRLAWTRGHFVAARRRRVTAPMA